MRDAAFESASRSVALLAIVACMFAPLMLIAAFWPLEPANSSQHVGEVTVGIAVILRATGRRLFRSASRSLFRTTFSAFSRASTRTFTRRLIRFAVRSLLGSVARGAGREATSSESTNQAGEGKAPVSGDAELTQPRSPFASLVALVVSFVVLAASFWGVLAIAPAEVAASATVTQGMTTPVACLLAAAPIVVFGATVWLLAAVMKLPVHFAAQLDALLLQGYFTGAGSFLPMTTDFEYEGSARQRATMAGISLSVMFVIHLVLMVTAWSLDSYAMQFAAAMFLIYCFVYAFPIRPLEGYDLWNFSKLLWLAVFAPVLISFLLSFPSALAPLL